MPQSIESSRSSASPDVPLQRALVLVVDPNPTTRSVLEVALSRDGFDVWSSSTGDKAFELMRQGRLPDVVVVESQLRGEDGFSFVAQLRGEPATANTPVLLLASAQDRNVEALAEVVGIDEYIQKPAYARDVVALVRLEHARRAGANALEFVASQLPPAHLLRALLSCPRSGRLSLASGRGEVAFRNGRLTEVRFEGKSDLDALVRALALTREGYRLSLETVEGFPEVQVGLRELVTQVMPRLARWEQVQTRSLPLTSKLVVVFSRLAPALKTMPDGINRVTQLFDGYRSLQDVLIDSPYNETLTLEIATRLYLMGVIVPASGERWPTEGREAPRLFEPQANEAAELMEELFAGGEIRGDQHFPTDDRDWFEEPRGTGLEVSEPSGGWTTTPAPEVLAGLAPAVQQQLEAFAIRMEVEPPAPIPEAESLRSFVRGEPAASSSSLEGAVQVATGDEAAQLGAFDEDSERTPPLGAPRLSEEELFAPPPRATPRPFTEAMRADAPVSGAASFEPLASATAASRERESAEATASLDDTALNAASANTASANTASLDAASPDSPPSRNPSAVSPEPGSSLDSAPSLEQSFFGEEPAVSELEAPVSRKRQPLPLSRWVAIGLAVIALGGLLEALMIAGKPPAPAPEPAPVAVIPAIHLAPPPAPVVEEAPAPEPAVDISENLTEARKFYENGQYAKALSVLEQVLSDAPRSVDAWLLTALVRYDANDAVQAKVAVEHVLELDPKNARVQILIASMAFDANDRERAHAALHRYLELDPNGPHAQEAQALLKR